MITATQKAASIHNGESTHHQDQVMTLHHFRTANTAQSNAGQPNLNKTLFIILEVLIGGRMPVRTAADFYA